MKGELYGVWPEMWRQVWRKLADSREAPPDIFCELYRELERSFKTRLDASSELAAIIDDPEHARVAFRDTKASQLSGENSIVRFLERAHQALVEIGNPPLVDKYFNLVTSFIEKYSLRYELRHPFSLHPTLPGVFAKLVQELRQVADQDAALSTAMHDFDEAVRDLRNGQTVPRIKTCVHKQMILLETMAGQCPGVTAGTLGQMCDEVGTWPHTTVKQAMQKIYGFSSDYPGIRHAGNPQGAHREIEMRDMVALSVLLTGFAPYLTDKLDPKLVYSGEEP